MIIHYIVILLLWFNQYCAYDTTFSCALLFCYNNSCASANLYLLLPSLVLFSSAFLPLVLLLLSPLSFSCAFVLLLSSLLCLLPPFSCAFVLLLSPLVLLLLSPAPPFSCAFFSFPPFPPPLLPPSSPPFSLYSPPPSCLSFFSPLQPPFFLLACFPTRPPLLRQTDTMPHINFKLQSALQKEDTHYWSSFWAVNHSNDSVCLSRSVSCSDLVAVFNFIELADMHSVPFACKRFSWTCQRKHGPPKRSGVEALYTILTKNMQRVSDQQPDIQAPYEPHDVRPG